MKNIIALFILIALAGCNKKKCGDNYCLNNGIESPDEDVCECDCSGGYSGILCETAPSGPCLAYNTGTFRVCNGTNWSATVYIDGDEYASMGSNECINIDVAVGTHDVTVYNLVGDGFYTTTTINMCEETLWSFND